MRGKKIWLAICFLVVIIATVIVIIKGSSKEEERQSVITVIQDEEFQFYSDIVQKEYKGTDEKELNEKVEKYTEEVYAQFELGRKYNLCKPYSYEALKMDVEAENQHRKAKNNSGEVVYGVLEYSKDGYLGYTLSNLKLKIVDYLVKNYDNDLEKKAKKYFNNNPDKFQSIEKIEYRLGDEVKTISKVDLPILEKTNSELFEYLYNGKEGDKFSISLDERLFDGEIISKKLNLLDFGKDRSAILKTYISDVYYDELVDRTAGENPIEFELKKE